MGPYRHRPYRHGKYHRPPSGIPSGTGSNPCVPPGRHRLSRANPIQPPGQNPNFQIASLVNSEHDGACRHVRPTNAENV